MQLSDFDFELPEELIAQEPIKQRDQSRLMIVHRDIDRTEHKTFKDLLQYLQPGDVLVMNDSKVLPARIYGEKVSTGAKIEVLLLRQISANQWETLVKPGKRAKIGEILDFGSGKMKGKIVDHTDVGGRVIEFSCQEPFLQVLEQIGSMPLPPYIKKPLTDKQRYQTVYARQEGSAAAPTAGLHFTRELLEEIRNRGVSIVTVLLHVGLGTFRPVQVEDVTSHRMHEEYYEITPQAAEEINQAKLRGGRVIAVGTTSVRCLETSSNEAGQVLPGSGFTDIFIYPGYQFKVIEGLVTNFHLPKSSLLMLISALAGREKILKAYQQAVTEQYRFFSFGDAMLII
ncbi:S-adenosylmethionine--tRNA ribosyltransferase-isomerase [Desulforamulus reducens MI-1]|uniref:S-adenosylmethionine:tRNA ribosyltransferase-isomerase n=1 Tax=Desulforamulus reducens (strain ATCC BAA-1160 / DSM 100696 / MI-1) TaxID=349161 RepID=QUEA_DESRM|nr:tRNA preQ1(34) S-adenosylmethionine ribosyltransferase-isomerase QueA [Desulforamulus reducens]A4J540.1 RecName: Full=S-adenosylmethionine:tRNA ribosyltransferase-isomerase; AltName: Full=Queuosine biosynthesis protein QueA [Desulforamulus reducens MI-1]ABO50193.1 S-adenosylmethionine--tRNA ribosyltransferase-isomerase [Desulforamulus reducens MI-1]